MSVEVAGSGVEPRRRPLGIVVVAVLLVGRLIVEVTALVTVDPAGILGWIASGSNVPEFESGTASWYLGTAGLLLIIATTTASIVGLWRFKTWGWSLALIVSGVILAIDLAWWYYGLPRYPGMFLNMVAVFYLNQRDVRAIFLPSSL
jgi:hypothetical protein